MLPSAGSAKGNEMQRAVSPSSEPRIAVNGIHHVALSVPDMDIARRFYVGILGFEEISSGAWTDIPEMDRIIGLRGSAGKSAMIRAANTYIELFEYSSPAPPPRSGPPEANTLGYTHICFDVSDADATYEQLREHGFSFMSEPQSRAGVRTVYGRDPFGNIIEFQQIMTEGIVRRLPPTGTQ